MKLFMLGVGTAQRQMCAQALSHDSRRVVGVTVWL